MEIDGLLIEQRNSVYANHGQEQNKGGRKEWRAIWITRQLLSQHLFGVQYGTQDPHDLPGQMR